MTLHIGFTGSRHGMTPAQLFQLPRLLATFETDAYKHWTTHSGDCKGADAEFHAYVLSRIGETQWTVGHIPDVDKHRAFYIYDEVRAPLPYMARNRVIVAESDVVIATPYESTEVSYGGTWSSVRMARAAGKPLAIIYPDGSVVRSPQWSSLRSLLSSTTSFD